MTHRPSPISADTLAQIKARLSQLPAKPQTTYTRYDAVRILEPDIRHAITEKGYSFADIAAIFTAAGAPVSPDTISNALRNLRPKPAPKTRMTKRATPAQTPHTGADAAIPPAARQTPRATPQPPVAPETATAALHPQIVFRPLSEEEPETEQDPWDDEEEE